MEKVYIEFLNASKGFRKDRVDFEAATWEEVWKKAKTWAIENLESFHPDMIKIA